MEINWSKIFDWSVVGVQAPYALHGAGDVFAYCVDVVYRHHGLRRAMFPVQRDCVTGREFALIQANRFFNKMQYKMKCRSKA